MPADQFFQHSVIPAGMQVVAHGSTAGAARPAGAVAVYWAGTVAPTNAQVGDLYANTTTGTLTMTTAPPAVGSPIAWWDFRQYDGSGQLAPRIGSQLMTFFGSPTYTAGVNVSLDNGLQYGSVPDDPAWDPEYTGALTVIAIFNSSGNSGGGHSRNVANHRTGTTSATPGWALYRIASSPYTATAWASNGTTANTVTTTSGSNNYSAFAGVFNPSGSDIILDGANSATGNTSQGGTYANAARLLISATADTSGQYANSGQSCPNPTLWRGLLIYNTALTTTQINSYATAAGVGAT